MTQISRIVGRQQGFVIENRVWQGSMSIMKELYVETANTLASMLRKTDWVACCYGGEEFLLLIRGANGEISYQVAEKLRKGIEELEFFTTAGPIRIIASFGLHIVDTGESNIDQIITQADRNLYKLSSLVVTE